MRTITQFRDDKAILLDELGKLRALCISESRDPSEGDRKLANTL